MADLSDIGPYAVVPAWLHESVSDGALQLFVALALHANRDTDECWPSRRRLAALCGCSVDTIDRRSAELVEANAIRISYRSDGTGGQRSNHYRLHFLRPGSHAAAAAPLGKSAAPPSRENAAQNQNQLEPESVEPERATAHLAAVDDFDEWWAAYPRKVAKPAARRAWKNARRKASLEDLHAGLRRWGAYWSSRAEPEFIPHPATWLNQERWNDDPPAPGLGRYAPLAPLLDDPDDWVDNPLSLEEGS